MKKKILITGAGGFIAHHLVKFLKLKGDWGRAVDIVEPEFEESRADEFKLFDLRIRESCIEAGEDVDQVYHLAAERLGISDLSRIAVIGDSLETDVAGGNAASIKTIWCTGGIHAEALEVSYGQPAETAAATLLAKAHGCNPWAIIPGFSW